MKLKQAKNCFSFISEREMGTGLMHGESKIKIHSQKEQQKKTNRTSMILK